MASKWPLKRLMEAWSPAKLHGEAAHAHDFRSHSFGLIHLGGEELGAQKNPMGIN